MSPSRLSRRHFLAGAAIAGCAPQATSLAKTARNDGAAVPGNSRRPATQAADIAAIVRAPSYRKALTEALKLAGGLGFVRAGERVLLKVNTNSGDAYPYSTNPEMVAYLCEQLRRKGAEVRVGDRSFWGDSDTRGNLERNGIAAATRSAGAQLVVFDEDISWTALNPDQVPNWKGPVRVPTMAMKADHIINLPCAKTHFITQATLSLKNALGWVHPEDRRRPGNLRTHTQKRIYRQVADINRALTPRLNVLDGHRALIGGGPTPSSGAAPRLADAHTVIVSADRIATDVLGIALLQQWAHQDEAIMRQPAWKNPMIRAAIDADLGIATAAQLRVTARGISAQLLAAAEVRS